MSYQHYLHMMHGSGELAAIYHRMGRADLAQIQARQAYHHMRLAGVSPFDNNLNLNIGAEVA